MVGLERWLAQGAHTVMFVSLEGKRGCIWTFLVCVKVGVLRFVYHTARQHRFGMCGTCAACCEVLYLETAGS